MYKKVLLKLSGEALSNENGYNDEKIIEISDQLKIAINSGVSFSIVIGGGNYWRGRSSQNIDRCKADNIGMLATIMNCIYVSEIFRTQGLDTAIYTPFNCGGMTNLYNKDMVVEDMKKGKIIFFAGGTGHPYFSTDTIVCLRALELNADIILLAKNIDGVYDCDPKTNKDAKKYDRISLKEVVDKELKVIDLTASVMCLENKIDLIAFDLNENNSIINAVEGKTNGTYIYS